MNIRTIGQCHYIIISIITGNSYIYVWCMVVYVVTDCRHRFPLTERISCLLPAGYRTISGQRIYDVFVNSSGYF